MKPKRTQKKYFYCTLIFSVLLVNGCKMFIEEPEVPKLFTDPPQNPGGTLALTPTDATLGQRVSVSGVNVTGSGIIYVYFYSSNTSSNYVSVTTGNYVSANLITFLVPQSLTTGVYYYITVEQNGVATTTRLPLFILSGSSGSGGSSTTPFISSLSPSTASMGAFVTVNGGNFSASNTHYINFYTSSTATSYIKYITATYLLPTRLRFVVPTDLASNTTYFISTDYVVSGQSIESNRVSFTVGSGSGSSSSTPSITSISPTSAAVGSRITITGTNFSSAFNYVNFYTSSSTTSYTDYSFATYISPSRIECNLPTSLSSNTIYYVAVSANGVESNRVMFTTAANRVTITSILPATVYRNTVITINGTNFLTSGFNYVNFYWFSTGISVTYDRLYVVATNISSTRISVALPTDLTLPETYYVSVSNSSFSESLRQSLYILSSNDPNTTPSSSVPTNGLVAYYPFNGNANDLSGNGNTGFTTNISSTTDRKGNSAGAFLFNGSTSSVEIQHTSNLAFSNNYSISVYVRHSSVSRSGTGYDWFCIFTKGDINSGVSLMQQASSSGILRFYHPGINGSFTDYSNFISSNTWIHYVVVRNGSVTRIYQNGSLVQTKTGSGTPAFNNSNLKIGGPNTATFPYYFHGAMDDLRIYNRALTDSEVLQLYNE